MENDKTAFAIIDRGPKYNKSTLYILRSYSTRTEAEAVRMDLLKVYNQNHVWRKRLRVVRHAEIKRRRKNQNG